MDGSKDEGSYYMYSYLVWRRLLHLIVVEAERKKMLQQIVGGKKLVVSGSSSLVRAQRQGRSSLGTSTRI